MVGGMRQGPAASRSSKGGEPVNAVGDYLARTAGMGSRPGVEILRRRDKASAAMNRTAKRVVLSLASFVAPIVNIISRKEERVLTAEIEKWIVEGAILSIVFSYPKSYPAANPCPERVVFRGDGWRAVYLEKGMKLQGHPPAETAPLLQRLEQEHILNLQNLLRFLCEHSDK